MEGFRFCDSLFMSSRLIYRSHRIFFLAFSVCLCFLYSMFIIIYREMDKGKPDKKQTNLYLLIWMLARAQGHIRISGVDGLPNENLSEGSVRERKELGYGIMSISTRNQNRQSIRETAKRKEVWGHPKGKGFSIMTIKRITARLAGGLVGFLLKRCEKIPGGVARNLEFQS